jgi:hypothetical protein
MELFKIAVIQQLGILRMMEQYKIALIQQLGTQKVLEKNGQQLHFSFLDLINDPSKPGCNSKKINFKKPL